MPKGTKYEGIRGVGASSIDSTVLQEAGQGTFYGGLKVTESIKNQLMEQEIGSYLYAVKLEDGDYLLKPKLPEKGQVEIEGESKVYSIRKNYNRIMKGIAGQFFDEKGNMDLKQAYEFVHKLKYEVEMAATDELTSPQLKKLIGYDKLDETERADFDTFMNVEGSRFNVVNMLETGLKAELSKAYHYQRICNKDKKELTPDEKKLLRDSARDYEQLLNRYVNMKNMDVENEYEFYLSADCGTSASIHQTHYKNVMHYRNPDAELADVSSISMEDAEGTFDNTEQEQNHTAACVNLNFMEQKNGVDANFKYHFAFAFFVNLNGQKKVMTLETSAAPTGKILFNPEKGTSGLGIYDNYQSFMDCNKESNYTVYIDDAVNKTAPFYKDIVKEDSPIVVTPVFIKDSLTKLQKSKRLFASNSLEYEAMRITAKKITQLKEQLQDNPENTEQLHEKLHEQYQILKDVAREYLDSRQGAKSPEGRKRLKLADALYKHAEKVLDNDEKLEEQVEKTEVNLSEVQNEDDSLSR